MSQIQQEKRRFPRKTLEKTAEVLDNDTGLSIGILEDVSKGGFSILTDRGVRPSETRNVTLILPGPQEGAYRVSMSAECVWCQTVSEQADFAAGFVLRSIEDQDEVALNYYIRDYQVAGELQEG
ncbi:PilZ domain-containing protein [Endozoicomonas acroporae]|uniref:PilZ domain-containing protein n=1 Tax=Endozoicomonas TaxID=305899 RepID=UPI0013D7643F|nr:MULTISPECIES: PilZ domain-containing protein [Endozoicomonas]WBA81598.1 PilZ domain-containing protein [Endozoicomonas sp. GU-1]WBA84551.1 PilZ domain-containing protein [Endozoicomonas sp. GU-1]